MEENTAPGSLKSFLSKPPAKSLAFVAAAILLLELIFSLVTSLIENDTLKALAREEGMVITSNPHGARVFGRLSPEGSFSLLGKTPLLLTRSYEKLELRKPGFVAEEWTPHGMGGISTCYELTLQEAIPFFSTLLFCHPLATLALVLLGILAVQFFSAMRREKGTSPPEAASP
ncbi:MAG: hypothetical protein RDV48_12540 [Candidatus Eremiobacteraeota bacterium]|nr:hypothetical protein [Candidatus Eremiobacteraeota bacterium]